MDIFLRFASWLFGLFVSRTREAGAEEQRAKTNEQNTARLERQNAVVNRPVTNDDLQKSLKDGSF